MPPYMRDNTSIFLIFGCLLLTVGAWCADKDDATTPEALISRARLQGEIWIDGTPPMLMRAEMQVLSAKGEMVHGDYTLNWISPSRWREEIRFGNYERLRVGDGKGYWQKSALDFQPEIIFQLDMLLHVKDVLKVGSKQTLGKVKAREKNGVRQKCTEVKWTKATDRIICFDEASGSLINAEYPTRENGNPPEISRIEYDAFSVIGGKLVPYEIRALKDRKVIAAIKALEIAKITEENPALFDVPPKAEFWAHCDDVLEAQQVERVQPIYPESARANHEQGRVVLYAVVEGDGTLSHIAIIGRVTPDLEAREVRSGRRQALPPPVGQVRGLL